MEDAAVVRGFFGAITNTLLVYDFDVLHRNRREPCDVHKLVNKFNPRASLLWRRTTLAITDA